MLLNDEMRRAFAKPLFAFCQFMKGRGYPPPSDAGAAVVAELFREFFDLPHPTTVCDITALLQRLRYHDVYLQPGLERRNRRARGRWDICMSDTKADEFVRILIDAARPGPSRIKTLLHELYEQLLLASQDVYDVVPILEDERREREADLFAAVLKLPINSFRQDVQQFGIDLPRIAAKTIETLGCTSRHIRDVIIPDRPLYFCRMSAEWNPEKKCPRLLPSLERSNGGLCVYIQDAVKTKSIATRRRAGGALPYYNVARKTQFRIIHPFFRDFIEGGGTAKSPPIYIPALSFDLMGWQQLAVMIYPIGPRRTHAFYVVAVHTSDTRYFDRLRETTTVNQQPGIDWLFSVNQDSYPNDDADDDDEVYQQAKPQKDLNLEYLSDEELHLFSEDSEQRKMREWENQRTRWPGPSQE